MNLSSVERGRLKYLHPHLVRVVERAAKDTPVRFRVMETTRTLTQQKQNIKKGVSKTLRSRHLPSKDGLARAVDLAVIIDNKPSWSWPPYHKLAKHVFAAAKAEKVVIEWGGNWKDHYTVQTARFADGPHFQLPWRLFP